VVLSSATRPVTGRWDAEPLAVAAAIESAIKEPYYDDAGHPTWSLWRVSGDVDGTSLDLRFQTYHEPGVTGAYPLAFGVRGALLPHGGGTTLSAVASLPPEAMTIALAVVFAALGGVIGLLMLGLPGAVGGALFCGALVGISMLGGRWMAARGSFDALPQVEAVLGVVGTPPAGVNRRATDSTK
jgi:hypothetical protein